MPGYNISVATCPMERQRQLKKELRRALIDGDDCGCWTRIERVDRPSDIMKLLAVNGSFYSFLSEGRHYQTLKAENWLLHEDEFVVHWVGEGRNAVGSRVTGEECEDSFFMYREDE